MIEFEIERLIESKHTRSPQLREISAIFCLRTAFVTLIACTTTGASFAQSGTQNSSTPGTESAQPVLEHPLTINWSPDPTQPDKANAPAIPTIVKNPVGLKEFKNTVVIDLTVSQSRMLKIENKIVRTSISDPAIAEPVVVCEDNMVLLGKSPGTTTLGLWDDEGNFLGIELRVRKEPEGTLESGLRRFYESLVHPFMGIARPTPIPPVKIGTIELQECKTTERIDLKVSQSRLFKMKSRIVRTSMSDPAIVEINLAAENAVYLLGKAPGTATAFIWDDQGNMEGIEARVSGSLNKKDNASLSSPATTTRQVTARQEDKDSATPASSAPQHPTAQLPSPGSIPSPGSTAQHLTAQHDEGSQLPPPPPPTQSAPSGGSEAEVWTGSKKDVVELAARLPGTPDRAREGEDSAGEGEDTDSMANAAPTATGTRLESLLLNNEGVKALNSENYELAISKLKAALRVDPTYKLAHENLEIAYNNYGLHLRANPKEALKQFQQALYLDRQNTITAENVELIIKTMGKDPHSFQVRCDLGDDASQRGDYAGAIVEYEAALSLQDDPELHTKVAGAYEKLGDVFK